ncbi:MAG: ATP-binding protein, partial [Actinomycetota bacterium]
ERVDLVAKTEPKPTEKHEPFKMEFDIGTIKHLGLQMYSTLPPVIGELVSNAWDAEAKHVRIEIPEGALGDDSEITVTDDGIGMTDKQVREAYLVVGRDRRQEEESDVSEGAMGRPLMGRKGIGKFSGFGIAVEVEVESARDSAVSRFIMDYEKLKAAAQRREITFEPLPPTEQVEQGTRVTLRRITKFHTKSINIQGLRRGLARRFSVIGAKHDFEVIVNGKAITVEERDLKRLLELDAEGNLYLWEFKDEEVAKDTGWTVNGWIGALNRTTPLQDGIQRGIAIMARGKLVQEPFAFEAVVGQQYALSYLIGELHAEFVDSDEDTIGTTRNSLVWDTERNSALKEWGQGQLNRIAREWAERRRKDNEVRLLANPLYQRFVEEAKDIENNRAKRVADKLIRDVINRNVIEDDKETESVVQLCIDFLEFDAFWELAEDLTKAEVANPAQLANLFREWEVVEAKEMARVTNGRIATIRKLAELIEHNALEVPTLHNFLKEFPWVLDPRWNLVADEEHYSKILREKFPDSDEPEEDRRIDFLCVRENQQLIVVEIKRPGTKASKKELDQIRDYVLFMRDVVSNTTDPSMKHNDVVGYLLVGDLVNTGPVRELRKSLGKDDIYVRRYSDLLAMVEKAHEEFLAKYKNLREIKRNQLARKSSGEADQTLALPEGDSTKA